MGGVDPTVHTYKAVMRACASAEQSRHVMQLLRQMERNNLTPTAVHYGIAVDACGRSGELKRMMNLLSEAQVTGCPTATTTATSTSPAPPSPLQARKLDLDAPTYTSAVHACATNGQLNRALGLVERMFKLDVKPDAATYNVLLQARLGHAPHLIPHRILRLSPCLPLPLQACDREGKPETLSELLVGMPQLGCQPTLVNYNTAIRGLACAGE